MLAWIVTSAVACALCGAIGSGSLLPVATTAQSFLYLAAALAATALLGSFDAYETQEPVSDDPDEN